MYCICTRMYILHVHICVYVYVYMFILIMCLTLLFLNCIIYLLITFEPRFSLTNKYISFTLYTILPTQTIYDV